MTATTARVVDGAVLIAARLHSGRESDLKEVLAVAEEIELDAVTPHLHQGLDILESEELKHGFRSDFGASAVSEETVEHHRKYLFDQLERLD